MKAPKIDHMEYLKYGFCKTRFQAFFCPDCGHQLNAGPDYQPRSCDNCGLRIDFSGVTYEDGVFLGYEHKEARTA